MKNDNYQIFIKTVTGVSYLTHRNRTSWKIKTARKHLKDVIAKKTRGPLFNDVIFFAVVAL